MKIKKLITILTVGASMTVLSAAPAFAGHCADNGGPGHSDFAAHARASEQPHNEGDHHGWASCEENAQKGQANAEANKNKNR